METIQQDTRNKKDYNQNPHEIKCPKCGGVEWVIDEKVCIGQEETSVKCECNTLGCLEQKDIFIDISEGVEDFN